ncbi:MAG: DUF3597 domain-containing protein [Pseudomonadota bacterium]
MSILGDIFRKIFPASHASVAPGETAVSSKAPPVPGGPTTPPVTNAVNNSITQVDVAAILNDLAKKSSQTYNWRESIVDLLKLLRLDSSLQSRKDLARELGYNGDTNDSASMNIWLHRQVMNKLAANGGKVPNDLKD